MKGSHAPATRTRRQPCVGYKETWGKCGNLAHGTRGHYLFCDACDRRRVEHEASGDEEAPRG